jgi:hypothetical protein
VGRISAAAIQRGRARPANDTWIAACALSYGLPLATPNIKDFKDFAEHEDLTMITIASQSHGGLEQSDNEQDRGSDLCPALGSR